MGLTPPCNTTTYLDEECRNCQAGAHYLAKRSPIFTMAVPRAFVGYPFSTDPKGGAFPKAGSRHILYRFHIMDPVRFAQDLKVTMQAIAWRSGPRYLPLKDDIASVVYWYQSEPHAKFPKLGDRDFLENI